MDTDLMNVTTRDITIAKFYIAILALRNNICNIPNTLILDGTGSKYTIQNPSESKLNGVNYNVLIDSEGVLSTINATHFDKLLSIDLQVGSSNSYMEECIGTPYGFKLSTILDNIEEEFYLIASSEDKGYAEIPITNGWSNIAHVVIVQKAFRIKKGNECYILFVFEMKNIGEGLAQKVLFKDVIPHGLTLCYPDIYLKYNNEPLDRVDTDNYKLFGREVFMRLNNFKVGDTATLSILTKVNNEDYNGEINVGVISYIGYQAFGTNPKKVSTYNTAYTSSSTLVLQDISNPKSLYKTYN